MIHLVKQLHIYCTRRTWEWQNLAEIPSCTKLIRQRIKQMGVICSQISIIGVTGAIQTANVQSPLQGLMDYQISINITHGHPAGRISNCDWFVNDCL